MNVYLKNSLPQLKRLLSLMERNPLSPHYGCFHRDFWLYRLSDFPSAIRQQGVLSLALAYTINEEENPYYQNPVILKLIEASLRYTLRLQKEDGSFDEWYPNERGWAGPTGYLLYAMARTYELVEEELSEDFKRELKQAFLKSAFFLGKGWEKHVLFNHIAMALLPIFQTFKITGEEKLLRYYHALWLKFESYFHPDEGWGLEYDGADIGYQSATVSFLARLHRYDDNEKIRNLCLKSIDFLSPFFYPDGSFSQKIGSRQTEILFHFGLEYWAKKGSSLAGKLATWSRESLKEKKQVLPENHDDHYFIYRLPEFLEAGIEVESEGVESSSQDNPMVWEESSYFHHFPKAGILCLRDAQYYHVINAKRGGCVLSFDLNKPKSQRLVTLNRGWMAKLKNGDLLSTLTVDPEYQYKVGRDSIVIEGHLNYWKSKTFTPITMIIFRKVMILFGWSSWSAYWLKALIRKLLLQLNDQSSFKFRRTIKWGKGLDIQDDLLEGEKSELEAIFKGGDFDIRFVPQSRYFTASDLRFVTQPVQKVEDEVSRK